MSDDDMAAAVQVVMQVFGDAIAGVSAEPPRERPEWRPSRKELLDGWSKPSPYWKRLVTGRCPGCGEFTPCGWVEHDGTAHREGPTRCLDCAWTG